MLDVKNREATVQCMYRKIRTRVPPRSSEEALYQHFLIIIYMLVLQFFKHVFLMIIYVSPTIFWACFFYISIAYVIITSGFGIKLNKRVQLWAVFATCFIIINHLMTSMWIKWGNTFYSGESVVVKNQTTEQNLQVAGYILSFLHLFL